MGFCTRFWYHAVRVEIHDLHGCCELRPETIPQGNDGNVGRRSIPKPEQEHGIWASISGEGPGYYG